MKIAVIGGGYVGLVMAAGLAELGHAVTCAERDSAKLRTQNKNTNLKNVFINSTYILQTQCDQRTKDQHKKH